MIALLVLVACEFPPPAFRNGNNDPTACPDAKEVGCYHLDGACWRPAPWAADRKACAAADACSTGGACTKWARCNTCSAAD